MITAQEFGEIHSILVAIVENELAVPIPVPEAAHGLLSLQSGDADRLPDPVISWLALLNLAISPHLFRTYIKSHDIEENTIRALLRFLVAKDTHLQSDRDKVDWLLTNLFQAREEKTGEPTGWPKSEVQEILQEFEFPKLSAEANELLTELSTLLEEIKYFDKFSQITDSGIITKGRDLKNRLGEEFFHPDVLTPIVNYNLVSGKKVHDLLEQTIQHVQEFIRSQPEHEISDARELLQTDYRSNVEGFRHLTELSKKKSSAETTTAGVGDPSAGGQSQKDSADVLIHKMQKLGINSVMESLSLSKRESEISARLKANPSIMSLPGAWAPLTLREWEAAAFRVDYAISETSFRAEFANAIRHALVIIVRIEEELPSYNQKKTSKSEAVAKVHSDTLRYLLYEGREHRSQLLRLSETSKQKGSTDKAAQITQTAEKLEGALAKVATILIA